MKNNSSLPRIIITCCFFLSGCAALIYEILWVRIMTLFLGSSGWAVSTVVASFMAGLAAGSFFGGKASDYYSKRNLLKIYIFLEIGIAVSAFFSKSIIQIVQHIALQMHILTLPFSLQILIFFMLGFCLLLIPTMLMGATLPVLARWFINSHEDTGSKLGMLYAVNTLGALTGAGITGFYLLYYWGITKSLFLAAGINICCAVIIFLVWLTYNIDSDQGNIDTSDRATKKDFSFFLKKEILIPVLILFSSGIGAMICQIVWTRVMVLVLGSSTYAFTIILFVFLLGISLGSAVCAYLLKNYEPSWIGVGFTAGIIAVFIIMSLPLYNRLPYLLIRLYNLVFQNVVPLSLIHVFLCMIVMLLPTLGMGALFPITIAAAMRKNSLVGFHVGSFSMVAIAGNIAGSLIAGFVLIPLIGTEQSLLLAIGFYTAASITGWMKSSYVHKFKIGIVFLFIISLGIIMRPRWNIHILSSGAFLYAPKYKFITDYKSFFKLVNQNEILY
ncbi:MAG: fused MFS/spermidine synthase, partial [bacterium]